MCGDLVAVGMLCTTLCTMHYDGRFGWVCGGFCYVENEEPCFDIGKMVLWGNSFFFQCLCARGTLASTQYISAQHAYFHIDKVVGGVGSTTIEVLAYMQFANKHSRRSGVDETSPLSLRKRMYILLVQHANYIPKHMNNLWPSKTLCDCNIIMTSIIDMNIVLVLFSKHECVALET